MSDNKFEVGRELIQSYRYVKSYKEVCDSIKDKYLSNKEFYDSKTDHVSDYESVIKFAIPKDHLIIPRFRGGIETKLDYAFEELIWYQSRSRRTDIIGRFGSIWHQMVDRNGEVNSNYGYQINRALTDAYGSKAQHYEELVNTIMFFKKLDICILKEDNIHAKNDVPCNNVFRYRFDSVTHAVRCDVLVRSLDLIYGLPYDMFYAQFIGYQLTKAINEKIKSGEKIPIFGFRNSNKAVFKEINMVPINCHIYTKHLTQEYIEKWNEMCEYLLIDASIIDEPMIRTENCERYSYEDYLEVKDMLKDKYVSRFTINDRTSYYDNEDRFSNKPIARNDMPFFLETYRCDIDDEKDFKGLYNYLSDGHDKAYLKDYKDEIKDFALDESNLSRRMVYFLNFIEGDNVKPILYLNRDMHQTEYNDILISKAYY